MHLARALRPAGYRLIDCQVPSRHLTRLGARLLPRERFIAALDELTAGKARACWIRERVRPLATGAAFDTRR